ncbi:hypothetical protein M8R19_21615 [Pseudomonas sp. R3.Fl]|uniref:hypothetical protein n=1 Tax=Pseudomonas sp. R3.Fl TaxID=2928708 RepID=UPI00201E558C|nr:hypothetical protein [Pseudomonas sp. R3.Fl]MCL6691302.1 hypothetical protein [Pseudomonas sp. R3.Fl]
MPSTSSPAAANKVALAMASSARFTASDEPSGTSSITTPSPEERRPHQPPGSSYPRHLGQRQAKAAECAGGGDHPPLKIASHDSPH